MIYIDRKIPLGIIIILLGSFLYVLMGSLAKILGKHLLINQMMFLQSFSGLLCASYFLRMKRYVWQQLLSKPKFLDLARIAMSLASAYALIYGLKYVTIFNALVILNSAPLIIPLLRKLFFGKSINFYILPATIIAFVGIVLILRPDHHIISTPIIIILISMLCMSFSLLLLEKNQQTNTNLAIFYYFFYSTLVSSILMIIQQQLFNFPIHYIPFGMLLGFLFFVIQLCVINAAKYISAQLISVLFYAEIIIGLFASMLLDGVKLNNYLLIGTALVILGGCAVILIENKTHQQSLSPTHPK